MDYSKLSINDFTERLAAKQSVPGGGGASALAASLGTALGNMVGQYTVGKKKYAHVEADIVSLMEQAEGLRKELIACIEDDAKAFEPLSKAYSISKTDPKRDEIMEKCLRDAAAVPFKILELACRSIDLQEQFALKGSRLMISDAATGAAILNGALRGAAINVFVNTGLMKDKIYANDLNVKVRDLVDTYEAKSNRIYGYVLENL